MPSPRDLRASDADRERVVTLLAQAAGDGRITLEEHAHRVQRAYTARTLGDLAGLTEDLALPGAQPLRLDNSRTVTAFFATERRSGRWVVPDRLVVTAIGGQIVLDLREALLERAKKIFVVADLQIGMQAALQKHAAESNASAGTTNLGALLKAKLSGSKDKE